MGKPLSPALAWPLDTLLTSPHVRNQLTPRHPRGTSRYGALLLVLTPHCCSRGPDKPLPEFPAWPLINFYWLRKAKNPGQYQSDASPNQRTLEASESWERVREEFFSTFRGIMALLTPWFQTSGLQNCDTRNFYCFELPGLWQFIMQCQETSTENFPYPALTILAVSSLFTSDSCGFPFFTLSLVFLIFWLLTHIQHFSSCHLNSLSAPHCWPFGLLGTQGKMTFPNIPRMNASH